MTGNPASRVGLATLLLLLLTAPFQPAHGQVAERDLVERDGLWYANGREAPYDGPVGAPGVMEGRVERGRKVGEWTWFSRGGVREFQQTWVDGKLAMSRSWHPNGRLGSERNFADGRPDGQSRSWDRHGTLVEELTRRNGRPDGVHRQWNAEGRLFYAANYRDGELDGEVTWWHPNGQVQWETRYSGGKRTGTWTQYLANGDLSARSEWQDGRLTGRTDPHARH